MKFDIVEESIALVAELTRIPIAFEVDRVLDVAPSSDGSGRFSLTERRLGASYTKDYDQIDGEGPAGWAARYDLARWGLLGASSDGQRVGAAVLAFATPGVDLLEGRADLAVLWDLRILPAFRRRGVGSSLFGAAADWARAKGCTQIKVETQNINVPACRFYERQGCVLSRFERKAYPPFPDEIQMLWSRAL